MISLMSSVWSAARATGARFSTYIISPDPILIEPFATDVKLKVKPAGP